jgi:hypothetical protein
MLSDQRLTVNSLAEPERATDRRWPATIIFENAMVEVRRDRLEIL